MPAPSKVNWPNIQALLLAALATFSSPPTASEVIEAAIKSNPDTITSSRGYTAFRTLREEGKVEECGEKQVKFGKNKPGETPNPNAPLSARTAKTWKLKQ